MEKLLPVMQQGLELAVTVEEAVKHVERLLKEKHLEEPLYLVEDIISAFASIQRSFEPVKKECDMEMVHLTAAQVHQALQKTVYSFESGSRGKVEETVENELKPGIEEWRKAMEETLRRYVTQ
ncbi:hypothetical protein [Alkalicoccus daliensis]|uniref:DUF8042 domain-containing protein n=1 Tax=Alkalicoccus daliensis TaxID=745820 RepID=A0A1H0JLL2_9BACI|nr:hypothetical protein [Alkalicoccus daliensis]SDO44504.1 hypothetical protein SAMN04488053_1149 [Alkalicoccus daliensis]